MGSSKIFHCSYSFSPGGNLRPELVPWRCCRRDCLTPRLVCRGFKDAAELCSAGLANASAPTLSFQASSRRDVSSGTAGFSGLFHANCLILETEAMPAPDRFRKKRSREEHSHIPQAPRARIRARRSDVRRRSPKARPRACVFSFLNR
jgi:hypothetical protein